VSFSLSRLHDNIGRLCHHPLGLWVFFGAPAATIILCCVYSFGALAWEYLHNPNRHLYEVAVMGALLSIFAFVAVSIAQVITYVVLPLCVLVSLQTSGRVSLLLLIAVTPLLGLSVWFGYEHFLPEYRFYTDQSPPYVYGLTLSRFLYGWAVEFSVVFLYWWPFRKLRLSPGDAQAGMAQ
jgi:hypothetical protein